MPTRWVGIDEAGYGPNLGPLVMTSVTAESDDDRPPDVWGDLAPGVDRAGGDPARLWVDDSKAVYKAGLGRERLEAATLAVLGALGRAVPSSFGGLLLSLDAGTVGDAELVPWLDQGDPPWPSASTLEHGRQVRAASALSSTRWRLIDVRAVVVGPARFNDGLARGGSKARVHHEAFARLLRPVWDALTDGVEARVRCDKHGGRHFYHGPLSEIFADAWVDRGVEGPALSRYTIRQAVPARRIDIRFEPRADAGDGLVALASLVSKTLREVWMDAFNAHWCSRIPGLRPTAGYPLDAARFREAIEPDCLARGLTPDLWWRAK